MDPAAFATYQPPQGSGGGLFRPSSSPFNGGSGGGDHRRGPNSSHHMTRNIQNSNSGSNMMSSNGGSIPQVKVNLKSFMYVYRILKFTKKKKLTKITVKTTPEQTTYMTYIVKELCKFFSIF